MTTSETVARPGRDQVRTRSYTFAVADGRVPGLGHAPALMRRPLDFLAGLPAQGDLVEISLGPRRAYLACHPDLVNEVLVRTRVYDKGGPLFDKVRLLIGDGLVSAPWEVHRRLRRLMQPAFHHGRLDGYLQLMAEEIDRVLSTWRAGQAIDVNEALHSLTLRITARTMFATDVAESRILNEVAACMPIIMRGVYQRTVAPVDWWEKLPLPGNRRFDQVRARMLAVIGETIELQRRDGTDHGDLLSILVAARDGDEAARLSDAEVFDQVMTLLIGGTETTANAIGWVLHVLAQNPPVEAAVHAEIAGVLERSGGDTPGVADIAAFDYTGRVLQETLRLYPPAWVLTRVTTQDTDLGGRHLPRGSIVLYSPYAMGHSGALFADPEHFDPDRWLPARAREIPPGAFTVFGGGSRKCIGDTFGLAEATLTIANIAHRFWLRPVPGARPHTAIPRASLGTGPYPMVPWLRRP
ncbi:cytochrome P450 [Frankia sp. AgPm24]|uniref:cytochrome P450 n=1 Tax=Frankia sp. AgPm24 TaxID=631128 RepID=UPI00200BE73A|nr:cytochrome P450 [Frankia sp. AgPm24]MCK9924938.1 cytochrome P450 [Frankia sp. AgPm24]